jgi:hypothetical protein
MPKCCHCSGDGDRGEGRELMYSMCVGAILAVADGFPEDLAIIGDVFMKSCECIDGHGSLAVSKCCHRGRCDMSGGCKKNEGG